MGERSRLLEFERLPAGPRQPILSSRAPVRPPGVRAAGSSEMPLVRTPVRAARGAEPPEIGEVSEAEAEAWADAAAAVPRLQRAVRSARPAWTPAVIAAMALELGEPIALLAPELVLELAALGTEAGLPAETRARLGLLAARAHHRRGVTAGVRAALHAVAAIEHADAALAAEILAATGELRVAIGEHAAGVEALRIAVSRGADLDEVVRARCELALALAQLVAQPAASAERFERAVEVAIQRGAAAVAARALVERGALLAGDDRLAAAIETLARAARIAAELGAAMPAPDGNESSGATTAAAAAGDAVLRGEALLAIGDVWHDRGERETATTHWTEALALFRGAGHLTGEGHVALRRARLDHEAERLAHAVEGAELVRAAAADAGAATLARIAEMQLALIALERGEHARAIALAEAAAREPATGAAGATALLHVYAAAARAWRQPAGETIASELPATVRAARIERMLARGGTARELPDAIGWDVRIVGRILAARRAQATCEAAGPPARVSGDGRMLWSGDTHVDLSRRTGLCGVLQALIEAQRGGRRSLDPPALFAAGWPGQRIDPESATRRVYWAIATLRRLGLATAIRTDDDGYFLDPGRVAIESPA